MKSLKLACLSLLLACAQANAAIDSKQLSHGVNYAQPGGYQGIINKVTMTNGQTLDVEMTPYALGSDRWNLMPPVIQGSTLHLHVACLDTPMVMCHDVNQTLSNAMNSSTPVNLVIERNAGIAFIAEFVPPVPVS